MLSLYTDFNSSGAECWGEPQQLGTVAAWLLASQRRLAREQYDIESLKTFWLHYPQISNWKVIKIFFLLIL